MKRHLSFFELYLYFYGWVIAVLYSLFKIYQTQNELFDNDHGLIYTLRDLKPGWKFISRYKDVSDIEWTSWKYLFQTSIIYFLFQFLISESIRNTFPKLIKYWYIISSIFYIVSKTGVKSLLVILSQPVLYYAIIILGGKRFLIWVTSIMLLAGFNSLKNKYYFWDFLEHKDIKDEEIYLLLFCVAWVELRCISFSLDYIENIEEKGCTDKEITNKTLFTNVVDMLSYVLYLPLLYVGPIMLYEDFEKSFIVPCKKLSTRLKCFLLDMVLYQIYTFIIDLSLHYIYFYAMATDVENLRDMPALGLCGGGIYMGLQFYMKYVTSYGTTSALAKLDNNEPPPTPRCLFRIHVYSQMWRYFDVGLYKFLVKYIYKPGYNLISKYVTLPEEMYKLLAASITFIFIFLWHGTVLNIFIWTVLNYMGILLEFTALGISQTKTYNWFKLNVLKTEAMETRFIAFCCAPLLGLSVISNFYLFAGAEVGTLYFKLLKDPTLMNFSLVYLALYCCCHVSIALRDVPSRTDVRSIKKTE